MSGLDPRISLLVLAAVRALVGLCGNDWDYNVDGGDDDGDDDDDKDNIDNSGKYNRMWRWWTTMAAVAAAVDNDKDSG